ncbi:MAG: hypothetical protein LBC71_03245 [Oscillospiraceae bacterium]|jgi:hypothetical protein|nr:hypothetical protein [Oscillospiraceae bacterium]
MSTINNINNSSAVNNTQYIPQTDVTNSTTNNGEFSSVLSNALSDITSSNNLNIGNFASPGFGSIPNTFLPFPSQTQSLENAIIAAGESGTSSDIMAALMMLMMMMQTGGDGGDMSPMMQVMSALIANLQGSDALRNNFLYNSGGEPFVLDTIDRMVFNRPIEHIETSGTNEAILPLQWWRPTTPAITSDPTYRSTALYRAVLDQFNVETAERYRPGREGHTYCNIFVWDASRAMGAEVPYYTDPATGNIRSYPDTQGANFNGAIAMCKWLETHGARYGWVQVDAATAQMHANMGKPAVTSSGSIGHVQMIAPSQDGLYDPSRGVAITQAGGKNFNYTYITSTYGLQRLNSGQIKHWIHP